ncbi:siderophore-interacting protein [Pannonibacter sp. Pt2-lr]
MKLLLPPEGRAPVWPKLAANGALILPEGPDGLHMRYYTLKETRKQAGEIDIDVVRHAGGAVSDWAEACREGDVIGLLGPSGFQHPPLAGPLLLAADGTGAPAVARMIEALAADMDREGTPVSGGGHVILGLGTDEEALAYLPAVEAARLGLTVHGLAPERFDADLEQTIRTVFRAQSLPLPGLRANSRPPSACAPCSARTSASARAASMRLPIGPRARPGWRGKHQGARSVLLPLPRHPGRSEAEIRDR